MAKNTRIVYIDPKNIEVYAKLSNEDFKEFFMTYLTYQEGDDVSKTISNPYIQALFMAGYADKIIANETKWENKARTNRENGKKGGRPKKNPQIEANTEFDDEPQISENKGIITAEYPSPRPMEEGVSDGQEMGKNEVLSNRFELDPIVDGEVDEDDCRNEVNIKEMIYNSIMKTNPMEKVDQEYINDIVDMIRDVTNEGHIDWTKVGPWVTKLSKKHDKCKNSIDKLFKDVMGINKAV